MQPAISVIVPIYNKEKVVSKCIESLEKQTLMDMEIILVDDGSTDKSGEICDVYALKSTRIKIIHKVNGGLSSARNAGLDLARGRYIGFVDGDDYIAEDMFEFLYNAANSMKADIAMCSFYYCNGLKVKARSNTKRVIVLDNAEGIDSLLREDIINVSVWNKIYKNSLFHNLRFDESQKYSEDGIVTFKAFGTSSKTVILDEPKYFYMRWEDGQSKETVSLKMVEDSIKTANQIFKYVCNEYPQYELKAVSQCSRSYAVNLYRILYQFGARNKDVEDVFEVLLKELGDLISRYGVKNIRKVAFAIFFVSNTWPRAGELLSKMIRRMKLEK